MSKEATINQMYNDKKREFEYFVKGFDVSESIRVLLKAHKEAYDNERRVFAECKGYCDAENEFRQQIADTREKLALTEKALELACNKLCEEMENPLSELYYYMDDELPDYFKTKAKEMMESE